MKNLAENYLNQKTVNHGFAFIFDQILPLLICTFGVTIQVSALITIYLSFRHSYVIEMYIPSTVEIPSISVCFFYEIQPNNLDNNVTTESQLVINDLNSLTGSFDDFVTSCELFINGYNNTAQLVDCDMVTRPITYISGRSKCFTLFRDKNLTLSYEQSKYKDTFLISFTLNPKIAKNDEIFMAFHGDYENILEGPNRPNHLFLDTIDSNTFIVTFKVNRITNERRAHIDCVYYLREYATSRKAVIETCMQDQIYNDYNAYTGQTFIIVPNPLPNITFVEGVKMYRYRSYCEHLYAQPECDLETFEAILIHEYMMDYETGNLTKVKIAYPLDLQTNIEVIKKEDTIEFICYVASLMGLWLEISVLTVAKFVFTNIRKICCKYCQKITSSLRHNLKENKSLISKAKPAVRQKFYPTLGAFHVASYHRKDNNYNSIYNISYSKMSRHLLNRRYPWKVGRLSNNQLYALT